MLSCHYLPTIHFEMAWRQLNYNLLVRAWPMCFLGVQFRFLGGKTYRYICRYTVLHRGNGKGVFSTLNSHKMSNNYASNVNFIHCDNNDIMRMASGGQISMSPFFHPIYWKSLIVGIIGRYSGKRPISVNQYIGRALLFFYYNLGNLGYRTLSVAIRFII